MKSHVGRGRWKWGPETLVQRVNGDPLGKKVDDTILAICAGCIGNREDTGSYTLLFEGFLQQFMRCTLKISDKLSFR